MLGCGAQRLLLQQAGALGRLKPQPGQPAHIVALDSHCAVVGDPRQHVSAHPQAAHQRAGAPVHEPRHQFLVQRVGEAILQGPGLRLPRRWIGQPIGPVGHIGQGADTGQPRGQGVDFAVVAVQRRELTGNPIVAQPAATGGQLQEHVTGQACMLVSRHLTEIRRLADIPQAVEVGAVAGATGYLLVARQGL